MNASQRIVREDARQRWPHSGALFVDFAVCDDDPGLMLTGTIPRDSEGVGKGPALSIGDIDASEVNENFARVPVVWVSELGC